MLVKIYIHRVMLSYARIIPEDFLRICRTKRQGQMSRSKKCIINRRYPRADNSSRTDNGGVRFVFVVT